MCTVSYIPLDDGYILTSNRDEDPGRETLSPQEITLSDNRRAIAPRDKLKGGTWIAIDNGGRSVCLLNGAFGRHIRQGTYRRSRGHYVLEALGAEDFDLFAREIPLDGIEPFTLLMISSGSILKLIWDGIRRYHWQLPPETAHLWSSPTLYSPRQHGEKENYFKESARLRQLSPIDLLKIHGSDSSTPFILERPGVRTVSITQLHVKGEKSSLQYLLKPNRHENASHISTTVI